MCAVPAADRDPRRGVVVRPRSTAGAPPEGARGEGCGDGATPGFWTSGGGCSAQGARRATLSATSDRAALRMRVSVLMVGWRRPAS